MSNLEIEIIIFVLCSYLGIKEHLDKPRPFNFPMMIAGWIFGNWVF